MGEKVEGAKNDGVKKAGDAGPKKDDGAVTAVFKIDMHCDGCATKVKRAVKHFEGVSEVKADPASNKLTVTGKLDPTVIKSKLEQKFKKKIEIVSPQPKKDGGGDKKSDEKAEKKPDEKAQKKPDEKAEKKSDGKSEKKSNEKAEKKSEEKKAKEITVVLKMRLHCEGCIQKIRKALIKFKGVNEIKVDAQKDLITVKGAVEGKDLAGFLNGKFKRSVEVVPPKKEEPAAAAAASVAGDKKGNYDAKMEVISKMEYSGYNYGMEGHGFVNSNGYYTNQNYVHEGYPMYGNYSHAPQMFSEENPNACSVM